MCLMIFRDGLLALLAEGPWTAREMARILRVKPDRVRRGLETLQRLGIVTPDDDALAEPRWQLTPDVDATVLPAVVKVLRRGPDGEWIPLQWGEGDQPFHGGEA